MSGQHELVPWLLAKIRVDLEHWRDRKAHFKSVREREGDYDYFEARERVAQLETALAVLGLCEPVIGDGVNFTLGEQNRAEDVVRQLARGYRHRPGYRKAWKP